ncbi:hypothetical protein DPMN_043791 [Dreissena polymorpha]|uniref:Uncharacterized protein n=1 Tax=Dreissena polymorpha TaxID=45954 RepID=A0A9D4D3F6_DREPO|nr:hypothetical protein DPMN_043791 [Dreissena polymorpha]
MENERIKQKSKRVEKEDNAERKIDDVSHTVDKENDSETVDDLTSGYDEYTTTTDDQATMLSYKRSTPETTTIGQTEAFILLTMIKTDQNSNKERDWDKKSPEDVEEIMKSSNKLQHLRDVDLKVIA